MPGNKILSIDDEPHVIELYKMRLETRGYQVEGLTDPAEARWAMRSSPPDLVIIDLNMPGQSGFELLTSLPRQIGQKKIYLIVLTARQYPSDENEVRNLGADAFFIKGQGDTAMIEKIKELLA